MQKFLRQDSYILVIMRVMKLGRIIFLLLIAVFKPHRTSCLGKVFIFKLSGGNECVILHVYP